MSAPEPSPVEVIKGQLREAEAVAAGLRQAAEEAANALVVAPTRANQVTRDELSSRAELAGLTLARLERDLAEAREVERLDRLDALRGRHVGEVVQPAQGDAENVRHHLAALEGAIAGLNGRRNVARSLTGEARNLGDAEASFQINVRIDRDVQLRLERLAAAYASAMRPVG